MFVCFFCFFFCFSSPIQPENQVDISSLSFLRTKVVVDIKVGTQKWSKSSNNWQHKCIETRSWCSVMLLQNKRGIRYVSGWTRVHGVCLQQQFYSFDRLLRKIVWILISHHNPERVNSRANICEKWLLFRESDINFPRSYQIFLSNQSLLVQTLFMRMFLERLALWELFNLSVGFQRQGNCSSISRMLFPSLNENVPAFVVFSLSCSSGPCLAVD